MKLSTRSRYGTRMMLELARRFNQGPVQLGQVAKTENISVKYLEQIIIPLKKAQYIQSVRGPKGGHMLAKRPEDITVGEVVRTLEKDFTLAPCVENPEACERWRDCPTRDIWGAATRAMSETLDEITLGDALERKLSLD